MDSEELMRLGGQAILLVLSRGGSDFCTGRHCTISPNGLLERRWGLIWLCSDVFPLRFRLLFLSVLVLHCILVQVLKWTGPRQANLCLRAFRHDKFQLRMPSHSEGLGICFSVWRFLLIHCLYERSAKVLARLRGCAGSPEPSLLA